MIKFENVKVSYNNEMPILENISFEIKEGECIVFTGESGSGKSSIINALNGFGESYDGAKVSGNIFINNRLAKNLKTYQLTKLISNVFQNPKTHFFNVNTTLELLFYLENLGLSKKEMDKRLSNMLKIFPIEYLLNRDIFKLSGGEKQILCIASCYISGTKIILLDEPSSNLDEKYIEILAQMLKKLKKIGITLIFAEHRLYYLMDIVDRIFILKNKKIAGVYSTEELAGFSDKKRIYYGLRNIKKPILKEVYDKENGELKINEFVLFFDNQKSKLIIKNLSFKKGKVYGVIGHNGCGKSTFIRSLIGVVKAKQDDIYYLGKRINRIERLKKSALVMQDVNHQLFTGEVESEVILATKRSKDIANFYLKELNLYDFRNKHPFSLSGGQKQRLAIASVLCKQCDWLFFDEPTSGMDYKNMLRISALLKKASNKNNIIFIVSHDVEFLNKTVDYIVNLEKYKT